MDHGMDAPPGCRLHSTAARDNGLPLSGLGYTRSVSQEVSRYTISVYSTMGGEARAGQGKPQANDQGPQKRSKARWLRSNRLGR